MKALSDALDCGGRADLHAFSKAVGVHRDSLGLDPWPDPYSTRSRTALPRTRRALAWWVSRCPHRPRSSTGGQRLAVTRAREASTTEPGFAAPPSAMSAAASFGQFDQAHAGDG